MSQTTGQYNPESIHWLKLRFVDAPNTERIADRLEAEFQSNYRDKYAPGSQKALLIATIMWLAWVFFDVGNMVQLPDGADDERTVYHISIGARLGTCLIGAGLYIFSWRNKKAFHAHMHVVTSAFMMLLATTQIIFGVLSKDTLAPITSVFIVLLFSMSANFARLPFRAAAAVNTWSFAAWLVASGSFTSYDKSDRFIVTSCVLLVSLIMFNIYAHSREYYIRRGFLAKKKLAVEEEKSHKMLKTMLPDSIIADMQSGNGFVVKYHDSVTILFSHVDNFDARIAPLLPQEVVRLLNTLFSKFDSIVDEFEQFGVYKIETIGDVYLMSAGAPNESTGHASIMCLVALEMRKVLKTLPTFKTQPIELRIGLHSGSVIAGVVGVKYPRYRLMGDTVNTSSRMSTTCPTGKIQLSSTTYDLANPQEFSFSFRGQIPVKGKGDMDVYILEAFIGKESQDATLDVQDVDSRRPGTSGAHQPELTGSPNHTSPTGGSPVNLTQQGSGDSLLTIPLADVEEQVSRSARAAVRRYSFTQGNSPRNHNPNLVSDMATPTSNRRWSRSSAPGSDTSQSYNHHSRNGSELRQTEEQRRQAQTRQRMESINREMATQSKLISTRIPEVKRSPPPAGHAGANSTPAGNSSGPPKLPSDWARRSHSSISVLGDGPASPVPTLNLSPTMNGANLQLPRGPGSDTPLSNAGRRPSISADRTESKNSPSRPISHSRTTNQNSAVNSTSTSGGMLMSGTGSVSTGPNLVLPNGLVRSPSQSIVRKPAQAHDYQRFSHSADSATSSHDGDEVERGPLSGGDTARLGTVHSDAVAINIRRSSNSSPEASAVPAPGTSSGSGSPGSTSLHRHPVYDLEGIDDDEPDSDDEDAGSDGEKAPDVVSRYVASVVFTVTEPAAQAPPKKGKKAKKRSGKGEDKRKSLTMLQRAATRVNLVARSANPTPTPDRSASHVGAHSLLPPGPSVSEGTPNKARGVTQAANYNSPPSRILKSSPSSKATIVAPSPARGHSSISPEPPSTFPDAAAGINMLFEWGALPRDNESILKPRLRTLYSLVFHRYPQLEADFQSEYRSRFIYPNRQTLMLLVFALCGLSIFESASHWGDDYLPNTMIYTWVMRIVALATAITLYMLTFKPHIYTAIRMQVLTALGVLIVAAMQIQIDVLFKLQMEPYGIAMVLMLISVVSSNFGLQFRYAFATSLAILIFYTVASSLQNQNVLSGSIFLWLGNLLYMRSAFSSEFYVRTDYILHVKQQSEEKRVREFLDNMLPQHVISEIKSNTGRFIAHPRLGASVLFSDIKGFTSIATRISSEEVVVLLNLVFSTFDALTTSYNVYKVETIGDAYVACSGIVSQHAFHTVDLVQCAMDFQDAVNGLCTIDKTPIVFRIGIHTGDVIAGVVGRKMPRYHLFGKTVSMAEAMEQKGVPGRVAISDSTFAACAGQFEVDERELVEHDGHQHGRYLVRSRLWSDSQQQQFTAAASSFFEDVADIAADAVRPLQAGEVGQSPLAGTALSLALDPHSDGGRQATVHVLVADVRRLEPSLNSLKHPSAQNTPDRPQSTSSVKRGNLLSDVRQKLLVSAESTHELGNPQPELISMSVAPPAPGRSFRRTPQNTHTRSQGNLHHGDSQLQLEETGLDGQNMSFNSAYQLLNRKRLFIEANPVRIVRANSLVPMNLNGLEL